MSVLGIDNNLRASFFGGDGSTDWNRKKLEGALPGYTHHAIDIRDREAVFRLFQQAGASITAVVHTAAQPSHDWAAREPFTDFSVNAVGTLTLLEATRQYCPEATFVFTSTNKVYGDAPNLLPLVDRGPRWEVRDGHPFAEHGIDESMSIDQSKHSLFGASKVAADVLTQEYARYFGMKTAVFRAGCITGPSHSGAELHGFLAFLVKCVVTGRPYTVFGYGGKQVRDNIDARDLANAFWCFHEAPKSGGAVYNIGGSRHANCSVLEAIAMTEDLSGRKLQYTVTDDNRSGDHIWWISDVRKFQSDYPRWRYEYDLPAIIRELVEAARERFAAEPRG